MRIELEITDEEIRQNLNSVVRTAVLDALVHWSVPEHVKKMVQAQWPVVVGEMIEQMVKDHEPMKAKIAEEIAKKLRAQVAAAAAALKQAQAE